MTQTSAAQARRNKAREKRRTKRQQIERSYREHTPPQVRAMRQENWFKRVNPHPRYIPLEGEL